MGDFYAAVWILLKDEGGAYVADDHGRGPSKWGVTLKTALEYHPDWKASDIRDLTKDDAEEFYQTAFWERYHLGRIIDQQLSTKMLDLAANIGPGTAIKLLQQAVGVDDDGILGDNTAAHVNAVPAPFVLAGIRKFGKLHYEAVVRAHPEWAVDLAGWMARLNA